MKVAVAGKMALAGLPAALVIALGLSQAACVRGGADRWVLRSKDDASASSTDARKDNSAAADTSSDGAPNPIATWVPVPAGTFQMGSPQGELCREPWSSLETRHPVTISRPFEISSTEVTQYQFAILMGYQPSRFGPCDTCPVEQVDWSEAAAYCNALSLREGVTPCYECQGEGANVDCQPATDYEGQAFVGCPGYRLPTEAEWEYAYRAGSSEATYAGDLRDCRLDAVVAEISWYEDNADAQTHPTATKAPNPWGLYDMAGNVWEWCHDWHLDEIGTDPATDPVGPNRGSNHLTRGGSWTDRAGHLRAAMRDSETPDTRLDYLGLRCVRAL